MALTGGMQEGEGLNGRLAAVRGDREATVVVQDTFIVNNTAEASGKKQLTERGKGHSDAVGASSGRRKLLISETATSPLLSGRAPMDVPHWARIMGNLEDGDGLQSSIDSRGSPSELSCYTEGAGGGLCLGLSSTMDMNNVKIASNQARLGGKLPYKLTRWADSSALFRYSCAATGDPNLVFLIPYSQ
jgi:hypothetical protein